MCCNVFLQKLLQRGQERDKFLAEMSQKVDGDHMLELRQTIQIMQEKLEEREGETWVCFKSSFWMFKPGLCIALTFVSVLSHLKLTYQEETPRTIRRTFQSPRKQLLS